MSVENLNESEKRERSYLLWLLSVDRFWINDVRFPFTNPAWYSFKINPNVYVTREYATPEVRLKALNQFLKQIPSRIPEIQANIAVPIPKPYIAQAHIVFRGYVKF